MEGSGQSGGQTMRAEQQAGVIRIAPLGINHPMLFARAITAGEFVLLHALPGNCFNLVSTHKNHGYIVTFITDSASPLCNT